MERPEIQRINFLRAGGRSLTYGKLGFLLIAWFVLLVVWYGTGVIHISFMRNQIERERARLSQLDVEKEHRLASVELVEKHEIADTVYDQLQAIFSRSPHWSQVLKELSQRLPRQLWLKAMRTEMDREQQDYRLALTGEGVTARSVTNFLLQLKESSLFREEELIETKRVEGKRGNFEFTIEARLIVR